MFGLAEAFVCHVFLCQPVGLHKNHYTLALMFRQVLTRQYDIIDISFKKEVYVYRGEI